MSRDNGATLTRISRQPHRCRQTPRAYSGAGTAARARRAKMDAFRARYLAKPDHAAVLRECAGRRPPARYRAPLRTPAHIGAAHPIPHHPKACQRRSRPGRRLRYAPTG